jgi:pantoate--beta-alanine ligase
VQIFEHPTAFQAACLAARRSGDLGLVPTMGYLHAGHEALLRRAAEHTTSALTIFVNPTQFGPSEDLSRYPRDLASDLRKAEACGIDLVLAPQPEHMYPPGFQTWVEPGALAKDLEGAHRPAHFRGVATVVLKLFQLAQPTHAYFGQKDYQQLAVIRRLVGDLDVPVEVVGLPTVREADGLALSSRNVYLTPEERVRALCLSRGLGAVATAFSHGRSAAADLEALLRTEVARGTDSVDYAVIRDARTLEPIERVEAGRAVALIAARVGRTRLIDNAVLT